MLVQSLMSHERVRSMVFAQVERRLHNGIRNNNTGTWPDQSNQDRMDLITGMLRGLDRVISRGTVSKHVMKSMLEAFMGNVLLNEDASRAVQNLGCIPPSFITISPTGRCNLKCNGCYASDSALAGKYLDFEAFDRILHEKCELWGSHWTVISGGEPFLWNDKGYDLVKLAQRHPADVFMIYTNGTLIDDKLAQRMAEAGNMTPSISVEGFRAETDARRGEGTHDQILHAMELLRKYGVPFGISATSTKHNWDIITSEEFADFYFIDQGAFYCWIFQYMPIGRQQCLEMMVPPESRVQMIKRMWEVVRSRKVFIVDFWNSGTAIQGCISAGRGGGYFYINWDGDIMPCVFTPYAADNIHDIYARGENLSAALNSPLFKRIRKWQENYGYQRPVYEINNWYCACAIRDHFDEFVESVKACGARPINEEAKQAMEDPEYYQGMVDYGEKMAELTDPDWNARYRYSQTRDTAEQEQE